MVDVQYVVRARQNKKASSFLLKMRQRVQRVELKKTVTAASFRCCALLDALEDEAGHEALVLE